MASVTIQLPHHRYEILIEPGSLQGLGERVRAVAPNGRCGWVADSAVRALYGETVERSLVQAGYVPTSVVVESGEEAKSLATAQGIYGDFLAKVGLHAMRVLLGSDLLHLPLIMLQCHTESSAHIP